MQCNKWFIAVFQGCSMAKYFSYETFFFKKKMLQQESTSC